MVHNLCTMASRAGSQTPFSSVNFGLCTTWEGRLISHSLMKAIDKGLGHGETALFPIAIFKMKTGITDKGSVNYDLFQQACAVSSRRSYPNFVNVDAPFNLPFYKPEDPRTHVATMGCRTRVLNNYFDPENQITEGRGNLFWTTINLPYLALEIKDSLENVTYPDGYSKWVLLDAFFKRLDKVMEDVYDYSRDRFNVVAQRRAKNYPFMMGQREYVGSENLLPEDEIREVIKEGTISFGFIGLAETLVALTGKHHGESEEAQELGLKIIQFMKDKCDMWTKRDKFNYSVMASPAEGCTGRLLRCTRKRFGVIPGITDKEYFTNSFHVEVNYPITAYKKIDIEAPYHALCLAGSISYVELSEEAAKNIPAFEQLVTYIASKGCGYFSINHPLLRDPICGYSGPFNSDGSCPRCGRKEFEGVPAGKLFELTTYAPDPEYDIRGKLDEDDRVYHPLPEESETLES